MSTTLFYADDRQITEFLNSITWKITDPNSINLLKRYIKNGCLFNQKLRLKKHSSDYQQAAFKKYIQELDETFLKACIMIPFNFCLFRGVKAAMNFIKHNTTTNTHQITDNAYTSTSFLYETANEFVRLEDPSETCCIFHIHFQQGQRLSMVPITYDETLGRYKNEKEILLPRGTTLEVITDDKLLKAIATEMNYAIIDNDHFRDETIMEQDSAIALAQKKFPFKTFKKGFLNIIPVAVKTSASQCKPI